MFSTLADLWPRSEEAGEPGEEDELCGLLSRISGGGRRAEDVSSPIIHFGKHVPPPPEHIDSTGQLFQ